ncbi:MAG: ABC transporter substrate-binding protein [Pseudomonadota bacterium]
MKLVAAVALATSALVIMPGLAAAETVLRVASTSDITSDNPGVDRSGFTDSVHLNIVEGLVGYRDDLSIGPVLAEEIQVSGDGLTYTFPLRQGVVFHNGQTMTAEHVLASWERFMDEETSWRCRDRFDGSGRLEVTSVEAPDDATVVFTISEPSPLFLKDMARFDCGATAIQHPDAWADGWQRPIGTGPFRFVEWRPGERIILERFEDYVADDGPRDGMTGDKTPMVDRVLITVVPDSASAKAAMRAGEVDLMDISTSDADELREAGFEVLIQPTPAWGTFLISRHSERMANPALRQAMARALDMEQLAMLMGYEGHNASPIPPISSFYTSGQDRTYGYDVETAQALLEEAGYDGEPIRLITSRRSATMFDQAVVAQAMWRAAGIETEIEVLEWGTQLDLYRSGEYDIMSFGFSARLDPALSWDMFSGEQQRKVWDNPEALDRIGMLMSETDPDARAGISDELMDMFLEQVPAIGLYSQPTAVALSDRVDGFELWPGGRLRFWQTSVGE